MYFALSKENILYFSILCRLTILFEFSTNYSIINLTLPMMFLILRGAHFVKYVQLFCRLYSLAAVLVDHVIYLGSIITRKPKFLITAFWATIKNIYHIKVVAYWDFSQTIYWRCTSITNYSVIVSLLPAMPQSVLFWACNERNWVNYRLLSSVDVIIMMS